MRSRSEREIARRLSERGDRGDIEPPADLLRVPGVVGVLGDSRGSDHRDDAVHDSAVEEDVELQVGFGAAVAVLGEVLDALFAQDLVVDVEVALTIDRRRRASGLSW